MNDSPCEVLVRLHVAFDPEFAMFEIPSRISFGIPLLIFRIFLFISRFKSVLCLKLHLIFSDKWCVVEKGYIWELYRRTLSGLILRTWRCLSRRNWEHIWVNYMGLSECSVRSVGESDEAPVGLKTCPGSILTFEFESVLLQSMKFIDISFFRYILCKRFFSIPARIFWVFFEGFFWLNEVAGYLCLASRRATGTPQRHRSHTPSWAPPTSDATRGWTANSTHTTLIS